MVNILRSPKIEVPEQTRGPLFLEHGKACSLLARDGVGIYTSCSQRDDIETRVHHTAIHRDRSTSPSGQDTMKSGYGSSRNIARIRALRATVPRYLEMLRLKYLTFIKVSRILPGPQVRGKVVKSLFVLLLGYKEPSGVMTTDGWIKLLLF